MKLTLRNTRPTLWLGVFFFSFTLLSCGQKNRQETMKKEIVNPNGDSELALAMRKSFDQTTEIKKSLENGELILPEDYIENLRYFHSAIPTDPEVKVDEFFGFVRAIEMAAGKLEKSSPGEQRQHYTRLVNTCIQCHQQFCPGPIRRINKLRLSKAQ